MKIMLIFILAGIIFLAGCITQQSENITEELEQNETLNETVEQKLPENKTVVYSPEYAWIIEKANNYIISLVGEDYFHDNFNLTKITYQNYVSNTHHDGYLVEYEHPYLGAQVKFNRYGNIFDYIGPTRPYLINVIKEHAIKIAKDYGLKEPLRASLGDINGSFIWYVTQNGVSIGDLWIVHVDANTGNILWTTIFEGKSVLAVEKPYKCPDTINNFPYTTNIDCMPTIPEEMRIYCVGDWANWIKENCNLTFSY